MRSRTMRAYGCLLFALCCVCSPRPSAQAWEPWQKSLFGAPAAAQRTCPSTCDQKGYPCEVPCEAKPRGGPEPEAIRPRPGPEAPEEEEQVVQRETGFYQAPPRTGAVQGATRSLGVSLGGITIPEMRLRLPSLELPCCFRSQQSARMMIDSAQAPWVSTGVETVRVGRGVAAAEGSRQRSATDTDTEDDETASRGAPETDCQGTKREYEQKLQELQRKIDDCENLKRCLQDCLSDYQRKSGESAGNQAGEDVPVKLPTPEADAPADSRIAMPRVVQPASFEAAPNSIQAPARLIRLPAVQDPRRLPPS